MPRTASAGDTVHFERYPMTSLDSLPGFAAARRAHDSNNAYLYPPLSPEGDINAHLFHAF